MMRILASANLQNESLKVNFTATNIKKDNLIQVQVNVSGTLSNL